MNETSKEKNMEENSLFQKLGNFLTKMLKSKDAPNDKEEGSQANAQMKTDEKSEKLKEEESVEKMLEEFFYGTPKAVSQANTVSGNLIDFSPDGHQIERESWSPDDNNKVNVGGKGELNSQESMDLSQTPNSVSPLKFRTDKGEWFCQVCQWVPLNNSTEEFLNHCGTTSHKQNLKKRFPVGKTENTKPNTPRKQKINAIRETISANQNTTVGEKFRVPSETKVKPEVPLMTESGLTKSMVSAPREFPINQLKSKKSDTTTEKSVRFWNEPEAKPAEQTKGKKKKKPKHAEVSNEPKLQSKESFKNVTASEVEPEKIVKILDAAQEKKLADEVKLKSKTPLKTHVKSEKLSKISDDDRINPEMILKIMDMAQIKPEVILKSLNATKLEADKSKAPNEAKIKPEKPSNVQNETKAKAKPEKPPNVQSETKVKSKPEAKNSAKVDVNKILQTLDAAQDKEASKGSSKAKAKSEKVTEAPEASLNIPNDGSFDPETILKILYAAQVKPEMVLKALDTAGKPSNAQNEAKSKPVRPLIVQNEGKAKAKNDNAVNYQNHINTKMKPENAPNVKNEGKPKVNPQGPSTVRDDNMDMESKLNLTILGLSFIQQVSEKEMLCTVCNKYIPWSKEFANLMRNVLLHINSKTHTKKLPKMNDSEK